MNLLAREPSFVLVVTYQYDDRDPYEIASAPTSKTHAEWLMAESDKLNEGSVHILRRSVYSEADYRTHEQRRVAEALVIS